MSRVLKTNKQVSDKGRLRALVVDDDPLNQRIMKDYLNKLNINIGVAENSNQAVEMYKASKADYYSLITMDIQMPVMDGLTVYKEIRNYEKKCQQSQSSMPITVVSANCTSSEKRGSLDPNGGIKANYFFRKPFTLNECQACVKNMLASVQSKA